MNGLQCLGTLEWASWPAGLFESVPWDGFEFDGVAPVHGVLHPMVRCNGIPLVSKEQQPSAYGDGEGWRVVIAVWSWTWQENERTAGSGA